MTTFTSKGIEYGWVVGENGWGDPMNLNLQRLSAMGFSPFSIGPDGVSGLDVDVAGGLWWNPTTEVWDTIADATLTLTNAATNYVEVSVAGVISANTTGFTYGARPIATVVTAGGAVTTITDRRTYGGDEPVAPGRLMGRDRSGTVSLKTGLDAVGSNTAATGFIVDAPRSTGTGTPASYKIRVGALGASGSTLQALADAFAVQEVANAASREIATFANVVVGGLALGSAVWNENGDTGRFLTRIQIVRFANSAGINLGRANGTEGAPSALLSGDAFGAVNFKGYDSSGAWVTVGQMVGSLRENLTNTQRGSRLDLAVFPTGSTTQTTVIRLHAGSTTIAEWVSGQATLRIVSGGTQIAFRDSTNASDTLTMNAAGTTFTMPLATSISLGAASAVLTHNGITTSLSQGTGNNQVVNIGSGTAAFTVDARINAAATQYARIVFRRAGVDRWVFYMDNTAEPGSDTGSQLTWAANTDAGVFIDNVLRVSREAGGTIAFSNPRPITSGRITIGGTYTAASAFVVSPTITATGAVARGGYYTPVLTAAANGDTLYGLQVQPSVNVGAFTGTIQYGIFVSNVSGAATNYAIRTGTGRIQFGDVVSVGGATVSTTSALTTPAGTTGVSSLRIPHGAAPTSPVDGDMWTTTAGLFVRINGATVGPLT